MLRLVIPLQKIQFYRSCVVRTEMLGLMILLLTVQFCRSDVVKTDAEIGDPSVNSPVLLEWCSED